MSSNPILLLDNVSRVHGQGQPAVRALHEVTLAVSGPFLRLKPVRASMLGLPTPILGFLRGYLPLPPLPLGAHLARVEPGDGEPTGWFDVDDVDEQIRRAHG